MLCDQSVYINSLLVCAASVFTAPIDHILHVKLRFLLLAALLKSPTHSKVAECMKEVIFMWLISSLEDVC